MICPVVIGIFDRLLPSYTVEKIPLGVLVISLEVTRFKPPVIGGSVRVIRQGQIEQIGAVDFRVLEDGDKLLIVWMAFKIAHELLLSRG